MNNGNILKGQFLHELSMKHLTATKQIYSNFIHSDLIHASAYLFE